MHSQVDQQDEQEKQNAADEALDQEVRSSFCCFFRLKRETGGNACFYFALFVFVRMTLFTVCFNFHLLRSNLKVGNSKLSLPPQTPISLENLGLKLSKISFWK